MSFDIAPRIMIAAGIEHQFFRKPTPTGSAIDISEVYLWKWGTKRSLLPHVYQKCNMGTEVTGTYPDFTLSIPTRKLTYGYHDDDLYELIHKKYDLFIRDNPQIRVKCQWNEEDYLSEHFRERVLISSPNIHDGDLMGRLIKVNSWNAFTEIAEITCIADRQVLDECIGFEVPLSCENYPYITYSKVGQVYTFSYAGNIASPIATTTWRYKYEGVNTWTVGNVVTVPVKNTDVQLILTFSNGCPPITLNYKIIVQLKPTVTPTKVGNIIEAQENGTHELTVSDTKIYYSEDGTNWKLYETGIDINRLSSIVENVYFFAEVTYTTGDIRRSDITTVSTLPTTGECPDPDQFVYPPTVVITKTPQSYFFYRSGEFNGKAVYDRIQYREKGKNQEWSEYDNEIISLMKCWEVRRSIVWCDEGCPPYCSHVVESDCGACVNTLTPAITPTNAVCTHEQKWENPDVPASATWKVEPIDNSIHHIPSIRTWIEQNPGAPVEIKEKTVIWYRHNFRTEYVYTWNTGATIDTLEVSEAVGLVIGAQHLLTLDIEYQVGDTNDGLKAALEGRINSELGLLGFNNEQDYLLFVSVSGGATKTVNIGFVAKHNPTATWLGANIGTDVMATSTGNIASTGKEFQLESTSAPILENFSPYGTSFKVRFRVSTVDYFLNDAASNFNEMVANASSPILTDTLSTALNDTGKKYSLTGSMAGCAGTTTWLWLHGGVKKAESGTVISRVSTADVFIQANTEVILIAKCSSVGFCSYEKRAMLTI
ncbi:MAG: hypothetical protein IPM42_22250 [Saprospiraceae bacterium]|nr:hypothetical protein [Saprospiraceae bacterium]